MTRDAISSNIEFITLNDIHGFFGFANYTCDPSGAIQIIESSSATALIGIDVTWFKVALQKTIDNTATSIFILDPDGYDVVITEPGSYFVSSLIIGVIPLGFNGTLTGCTFVDNGVGMFDVLRRIAYECDNLDFLGTTEFGPMAITSSTDVFSVTEPTVVVLRYMAITSIPIDIAIISARMKLTKI